MCQSNHFCHQIWCFWHVLDDIMSDEPCHKEPPLLGIKWFLFFSLLRCWRWVYWKENYTNLMLNNAHGCLKKMIHVPGIYTTHAPWRVAKKKQIGRVECWFASDKIDITKQYTTYWKTPQNWMRFSSWTILVGILMRFSFTILAPLTQLKGSAYRSTFFDDSRHPRVNFSHELTILIKAIRHKIETCKREIVSVKMSVGGRRSNCCAKGQVLGEQLQKDAWSPKHLQDKVY